MFREEALSHAGLLCRLARLYVRTPPAAEDLVRGAYLRAFESRAELSSGPGLRVWLAATLRGLALRRRHEDARHDPPADTPLVPESLSFDHVLPQELDGSLRSLPEPARFVLWLADAEGFRYEEISDAAELSVSEVRTLLADARAHLATDLAAFAAAHAVLRSGR